MDALPGFVPVPGDRAERYRRAGYWTGQTLDDLILDGLRRQDGDRVALFGGPRNVTCGELIRSVEHLARRLHECGMRRGHRMVVQLPNSPAFVLLVLALWRIGAIPAMALPAYREHELRHIATASGAVAIACSGDARGSGVLAVARRLCAEIAPLRLVLVADEPFAPPVPSSRSEGELAELGELRLSELLRTAAREPLWRPPGPSPADVAVMLLSGGTTGLPKLIPRTHDDYGYNLRVSSRICGVSRDTVYLAVLPCGHNFTLGCPGVMGTLLHGGQVVLASAADPGAILDAVQRHQVTMTAMVPTVAEQVAETAAQGSIRPHALRLLQVGGARLSPQSAHRVTEALGWPLQQVYGMAEGLLNFTRLDDPAEVVQNTQGRPASPGDEVRIVDETGAQVGVGAVGELCCRGPYTIAGYFGSADNSDAFTADGFYRSGDLVRWHESGNLIVVGRLKDVINRAGEKVGAAELEVLLGAHPGIAQVAVVAIPSDTTGEGIGAFVVPARGGPAREGPALRLSEIRRFLAAQGVAMYKLPVRLELLTELPVTPVGKIDKHALRLLGSGPSAAKASP
jgi:2,3-dihydroxybenzoate-AMP ligase